MSRPGPTSPTQMRAPPAPPLPAAVGWELERIEARLQQHADPRPRPLTYQITADLVSLSPVFLHWEKVLGTHGATVEHHVLYAARLNS